MIMHLPALRIIPIVQYCDSLHLIIQVDNLVLQISGHIQAHLVAKYMIEKCKIDMYIIFKTFIVHKTISTLSLQ